MQDFDYFDDFEENKEYAFMQDSEEIIEYREALSPELKSKHHKNILSRGRKFVGLGFICGYNCDGELWTKEVPDLIYV